MIKHILFTATILASMGAISPVQAQKAKSGATTAKREVKFLENISVEVPAEIKSDPKAVFSEPQFAEKKVITPVITSAPAIENANSLQLKYALLLDMEVEEVRSLGMFKVIDEWFGTKYRLGGTT